MVCDTKIEQGNVGTLLLGIMDDHFHHSTEDDDEDDFARRLTNHNNLHSQSHASPPSTFSHGDYRNTPEPAIDSSFEADGLSNGSRPSNHLDSHTTTSTNDQQQRW